MTAPTPADFAEPCTHPVELREMAVLGEHHYCPGCRSVLTETGVEPVVIRKMVTRRG